MLWPTYMWERKEKDEAREIRKTSSAREAGMKTATARAAARTRSEADASRHLWATDELWAQSESAGTCSAEPNSRGNVLSCRLRMRAHAEKCWKLTDQDGQQLRKQVTAACWTFSLFSSLLISHLFQGCQDSPSQPLYPVLAYSVFRCFFFLRKKSIELTCWLQTVARSWFLAAASCSLSLCLPCLVKKNKLFWKRTVQCPGL